MDIEEKLNFIVDNKDTEEVKYPHVYKLFEDIEIDQESEVFNIWMDKIEEKIDVKIKYIENYCKEMKCDFMIALYTVYKRLKEKPYLCHFYNNQTPKYAYYSYSLLHSLFWSYRSFPPDSNVEEENKRYKTCLKQMFEILDTNSKDFNSQNAMLIGFHDFYDIPILEIQKNDIDCAYLERLISSYAEERKANPEPYIKKQKISIVKENFHTEFWELENEFYILKDGIIINKDTEVNKPTNENIEQETEKSDINLSVGSYDKDRTKQLYDECKDVVFYYCALKDFVNSINNPEECILKVKNKNLLIVLYEFFNNIFKEDYKQRIEELNLKLGVKQSYYSRKKFNYDNATNPQKELYDILVEI